MTRQSNAKDLLIDAVFLLGAILIGIGGWMIHPALACVGIGSVMVAVAMVSTLRGKSS